MNYWSYLGFAILGCCLGGAVRGFARALQNIDDLDDGRGQLLYAVGNFIAWCSLVALIGLALFLPVELLGCAASALD